jgi:hypothetical protein
MSLSKQTRDGIGRAVRALRRLFEDEFSRQASGRFGIRNSVRSKAEQADSLAGWLDPVGSLSLTPVEEAQRNELVHALRFLCAEGLSGGEAVQLLIREAAFTAVNRLLAVRVAEAVGVLPQVLANGRQSTGYRDTVRDLFPVLAHDDGSYWTYVQVAGDELAAGVPRLFDRRTPVSAFVPSRACVDKALDLINTPELSEVWAEPETLGWGYQFFNGDDVAMMRAQSPAQPRNSRELAVRNQFFTPRYVVDWLVQNTLGRRLAQAGYYIVLPLLVGEIGDAQPLSLEDVRVLDPAVGSGHFLLGCYDLLEKAWETTGLRADQAAPRILPCLFGVDIDPRAAQVAQAVLLLRARHAAPTTDLPAPTIVTAVALPHNAELRREAFGQLSSNAQDLAHAITDALSHAPQLGTLLKVEQRLADELDRIRSTPKLAADASEATVLEELYAALERLVTATATPEERMFTADAEDALRFVEICRQRYDTVLMNPPFGDPIPETRPYIRDMYASTNLYAAFVERGLEMLRDDGLLGAITSRTGFFLETFKTWRAQTLLPHLACTLDLGQNVMHEAMVEATAYVLESNPQDGSIVFRDLLNEKDKPGATYENRGSTYQRERNAFLTIPEQPVPYWLPQELIELWRRFPKLEADCRVGLQTSDDTRFVRLWWEVKSSDLGRGKRWLPFAKGGEYSPYYADLHLVVDWENNGERIRSAAADRGESESRTIRSQSQYFRPGLTWSVRSQKGFSIRPLPADSIFGHVGPTVLVNRNELSDLYNLMGYLNSTVTTSLLEALSVFGKYESGMIKRLPSVRLSGEALNDVMNLCEMRCAMDARIEVSHVFTNPWHPIPESSSPVSLAERIDEEAARASGLSACPAPSSLMSSSQWLKEEGWPAKTPSAFDEVSYLVGVAFGRWDVRCLSADYEMSPLPCVFDPLPPVSRGMLVDENGLPALRPPPRYPLNIPADRLLHDDPGHPADIVAAVECAARVVNQAQPLQVQSEIRDLRKYLRDRFFALHLNEYSASRRYAPIYWQLAVPSKRWSLWLYAPSMTRESLFAIARAARDKLSILKDRVTQARQALASGGDQASREQAESLEDLIAEIEKFAGIADQVAHSGWEPDLNDGFVLNAAPLEALFVDRTWRTQIAVHREALQEGKYWWASVQNQFFGHRQ